MTKELSKQLCELCGIEPKIRYHVKIAGTVYKISKENVLKHSGIFRSPSIKVRKVTKDHPDFSNPENFVRLFKLITTIEGYVYRTGFYYIKYIPTYKQLSCLSTDEGEYSSENTDPIKAFITCVIKCARAEKDTADYIREAEWVYD